MTSSILEVFGFGHLKTSPSWGEVPFLCPKILTAQGLRLLQNAHLKFLALACLPKKEHPTRNLVPTHQMTGLLE